MLDNNLNSQKKEFLSPKELAADENVTVTSVYKWLKKGLPFSRRGIKGTIIISRADYRNWMIDCAKQYNSCEKSPCSNVPDWAFKTVKGL